jgi:hypothetical protein
MAVLRARVKGGHIVVDEPTDLPDGTELKLLLLEGEDEMTAEECADLDAMIERGRADIAAGRGVSPEDLLARIRAL